MRLTKSTSHAIRILIDCARAGDRLIKVAELSERLEITQQNVFKIVNLLTRAGLIEAVRGRNGGVRLARSADEIRIGDVVRATEVTHVEIEEGAAGAAPDAAMASTGSSTMRSGPSSRCSISTPSPTWQRRRRQPRAATAAQTAHDSACSCGGAPAVCGGPCTTTREPAQLGRRLLRSSNHRWLDFDEF